MTAPLVDAAGPGIAPALGAALVIGVAFGWCLERAGLGSARKLAGQFYLTDLTVFKVMFTAIVTAMLGTFWLARVGWLDLTRVYVPETFLLPQLTGGLVFGVGFALGGLCPGTSCVAAATGRGDGLAVVAGMFTGVLGTGLAFDRLRGFYEGTARGPLTLDAASGLPQGVVALAVTLAAVGGCVLASKLEGQSRRSGASRSLAIVALALAGLATVAGAPLSRVAAASATRAEVPAANDRVRPLDLAQSIREREPGVRPIDARSAAAFADYHVPTAEHVPAGSPGPAAVRPGDLLVVYAEDGALSDEAAARLAKTTGGRVRALEGGMDGWMSDVMGPRLPDAAGADERAAFARTAALSRYFGGTPRIVRAPSRRNLREPPVGRDRGTARYGPSSGSPRRRSHAGGAGADRRGRSAEAFPPSPRRPARGFGGRAIALDQCSR